MKVVLDTNVIISGFLFSGRPLDVLEQSFSSVIELFSSEELLKELWETLNKKKFQNRLIESENSAESILETYRKLVTIVSLVEFLEEPDIRDPEDINVLSTAFAANAQIIVTGDNDLLVMGSFSNIRILSPAEFINLLHSRR